jgi:hypothetical protein
MYAHLLIALSLSWSGTMSFYLALVTIPILIDDRLSLRRWLMHAAMILLAGVFGLIAILAGFVMIWRQLAG